MFPKPLLFCLDLKKFAIRRQFFPQLSSFQNHNHESQYLRVFGYVPATTSLFSMKQLGPNKVKAVFVDNVHPEFYHSQKHLFPKNVKWITCSSYCETYGPFKVLSHEKYIDYLDKFQFVN